MLYVIYWENGNVEATGDWNQINALRSVPRDERVQKIVCRGDSWKREEAETIVEDLNERNETQYLVVDRGRHCHPRYDICRVPEVGDEVSYGFNGDSYPDGVIVKVGAGPKKTVTTDTGSVYYRRKETGAWVKKGGTWCLVRGHVYKQNPSF